MEAKIGVIEAKEIEIELPGTMAEITKLFDAAMKANDPMLWLIDVKGNQIGVQVAKIGYVELKADGESKHVGFGR